MSVRISDIRGALLLEDKFTATFAAFTSQLVKTEKDVDKIGANLGKFGGSIQKVGLGLSAMTAGLGAAALGAVKLAADFEQAQIGFTTMLGSAEKAKVFLADLEAFAARTPFEFPELIGASQRLLAFGFAAEKVIPMMTAVGNAAAATGGGAEKINRITFALGQMAAKGRIQAEEMNQLAESNVKAWEMLANKMGVTVPEAMEKVRKGQVDAMTGIDAIVEGMQKKFGGMMENQSKTISGRLSTMKDEFNAALRTFGQALLPVVQDVMKVLTSLIPVIQSVMKSFGSLDEGTRKVIIIFAALVAAIGPFILILGTTVSTVGTLITTMGAVKTAMIAFGNTIPVLTVRLAAMNAVTAVTSSLLGKLALVGAAAFVGWQIGKLIDDTFQLSKKIGELVSGVENLRRLEKGTGSVGAMTMGIDATQFATMDKWKAAIDKVNEANAKLRAGNDQTKTSTAQVNQFSEAAIRVKLKEQQQTELLEKATKLYGRTVSDPKIAAQIVAQSEAMNKSSRAMEEQAEKAKEATERMKALREEFAAFGRGRELLFQAGALPGQKKNDPFFGIAMPGLATTLSANTLAAVDAAEALKRMKEVLFDVGRMPGQQKNDPFAGIAMPGLATTLSPGTLKGIGTPAGISLGKAMSESFKSTLTELPNIIIGAIQGGGKVGQSIGAALGGSLSKTVGDTLGKKVGGMLGKTLGSVVPVVGTLLGGFVGDKLGGLVGKIFGGGEVKQVNDMRDAFISAHGGWQKLQQSIAATGQGDLLKKVFDAKTVKEFEEAVKGVNDAFALQKLAQDELNAAIQEYGFTAEELPAKLRGDKAVESLNQIWKQWQLLNAAGFDHAVMLERMGPKMVDFVNEAREAGVAIPMSMKPMIDELIRSGQLVDENGEAFASAEDAGITFAETMTEAMTRTADAVEKLVTALLGIGNVNVTPKINLPNLGGEGTATIGKPGQEFVSMRRGGLIREPTFVHAGDNGPEVFAPFEEFQRMREEDRASGGGDIHVKGEIDGRVLIDFVAEARRDNRFGAKTRLG